MNDSLRIVIDSLKNNMIAAKKDTVYFMSINNESDLIKLLPIIITTLALLISGVSVYISYKALTSNHIHQKLSVQPLLTTFEDFSFRNLEGIGIGITNCGLGPAIIQSIKILWEGIEVTNNNLSIITENILIPTIEMSSYVKDGIIEKDSPKWMLRIPSNQLLVNRGVYDLDKANLILNTIRSKLKYEIVYTSIYEDEESKYILLYPFGST